MYHRHYGTFLLLGSNPLLITLLDHWYSDAVHCYLLVQSFPIMSGLSKHMLFGCGAKLLPETNTMARPNPFFLFVG